MGLSFPPHEYAGASMMLRLRVPLQTGCRPRPAGDDRQRALLRVEQADDQRLSFPALPAAPHLQPATNSRRRPWKKGTNTDDAH